MPKHPDPRDLLRSGDALLKAEDFEGAVRAYFEAAGIYERDCFALEAIGVYKQARELIRLYLPEKTAVDHEARMRLAKLYRELGLHHEAQDVESDVGRILN